MVDVFGKAALLTGQLPQAATATECAELLQLVPEPPVAVAHVLDRLPRMRLTVAIGRNVPDAQIDTERAVNINRIWRFNLARRKQIPVAAHECQIGFAAPGSEQLALPLTTDERYGLPPAVSSALSFYERMSGTTPKAATIVPATTKIPPNHGSHCAEKR